MKKQKDILNSIIHSFVVILLFLTASCQKDDTFKNLEASFTVDKTEAEVGEQLTFTITGVADYFVIWTGEESNTPTSVEGYTFNYTYNAPGTFKVKLLASSVNNASDEIDIKRDSAFITVNIVDNPFAEHTKFSFFRLTLREFTGFEDQRYTYNQDGIINGNEITVSAPYSTDLSSVKAIFIAESYSTVYVNDVLQVSNVTLNDFSQTVNYTIVSNDGTEVTNTVTVVKDAKSSEALLTEFSLSGMTNDVTFNGNNVYVAVPDGTDIDSVVTKFELSNFAKVYVNSEELVTRDTVDYTLPVIFKVIAEDGTENDYTVTVLSNPVFTSFYFPELSPETYISNISETNDTIFVLMQEDIVIINLNTGFITAPGDALVTIDDVVQTSENSYVDFTNPVPYVVTNGALENNYIVSVSRMK